MKTIKILSIISLLLLIACGQNENSDKENRETATKIDEEKKEEIQHLEQIQTLDKIYKLFGATDSFYTFDNLRYKMTYQYQNLIEQNDRVVIKSYKINDIEKIDSEYIVSIKIGLFTNMFIEFICNQNQIEKIYPEFINGASILQPTISDRFLILKINTVKKIKLKIDSDDKDKPTNYVKIDASEAFICKGEFIDIYLKSKI